MYKNRLAGWIWPSGGSLPAPDVLYANKLSSGVRLEKAFQAEETASTNALWQYMFTKKMQTNKDDLWYQSKGLIIDTPGKVGPEYGEP